jgi:hypothetical protein
MKSKRSFRKYRGTVKAAAIKTSLLELIQEVSNLAKDDALVVATVKSIFGSYRVRCARSLAPVRLVGTEIPDRRAALYRKGSDWA